MTEISTLKQLPLAAYIAFSGTREQARDEFARRYPWLVGMCPEYYFEAGKMLYIPAQFVAPKP